MLKTWLRKIEALLSMALDTTNLCEEGCCAAGSSAHKGRAIEVLVGSRPLAGAPPGGMPVLQRCLYETWSTHIASGH